MTEITVELADSRAICEAQEWLKSNCTKKYFWYGFDFDYAHQEQTGKRRRKVRFDDERDAFLFRMRWA